MTGTLLCPPQPLERLAILRRRAGLVWEGNGVSNPGVARLPDGTIAMVYRGHGSDDVHHLGYCRLDPEGRRVLRGTRAREPLTRRFAAAQGEFPDGYGDARLTKVGEWYYIWANGRDDRHIKRDRRRYGHDFGNQYMGGRQLVAFRTRDFRSIEYLGLTGPDEFDKNAYLHPEPVLIDGTPYWALFHRIQYTIQVALGPSVEFFKERQPWREHVDRLRSFTMMRPELRWEGAGSGGDWPGSIGGGTPPLRVGGDELPAWCGARQHWLMFYNAASDACEGSVAKDRRVGAVLFTTRDHPNLRSQPFTVVARAAEPVLEPRKPYELGSRNGDVVFATGAVRTLDNKAVDLFYGSGDVIASKARFLLRELIDYLCQFDAYGRPVTRTVR
jgi:predicted GH43/DUF377 family glycosyl hydrolase